MKASVTVVTLFGAMLAAAFSPSAMAAQAARDDLIHAQGACQPTVPTSSIRAYSTGLRNVGASAIYVTCATFGQWFENADGANFIRVAVANVNGSARTVNCTLYTGWASTATAGAVTQGTFPKSVSVAANGVTFIDWDPAVVLGAGHYFANASFTCLLQPYTEIKWIRRTYNEEIGT